MAQTKSEMLRLDLQFFGEEGGETAGAGNDTAGAENTSTNNASEEDKGLTPEAIQKMIQSAVDARTADLGKTIATLKKDNAELKKANMTAEEIQKAEREAFEAQKAEVEFQKREIFAHKAVAKAGYVGDDVQAVVDIVLGNSDEETSDKLQKLTAIIDKVAAKKVDSLYAANGRDPKAAHSTDTETVNIAEKLGAQAAEADKQAQSVLKHYLGGNS